MGFDHTTHQPQALAGLIRGPSVGAYRGHRVAAPKRPLCQPATDQAVRCENNHLLGSEHDHRGRRLEALRSGSETGVTWYLSALRCSIGFAL